MRDFLIHMARYWKRDEHQKRRDAQAEAECENHGLSADMLHPLKIPLAEGLPDDGHGGHA